ncbi:MAG: hypothetical protein CENE_02318 [Candidatus Celerinatantimonas neptuna]|nr:MAG: hypothetical protein CENE_02318 [Candidatus Celerinatantimonas neptuna]
MTINNVVVTNILIALSFITTPIAWADDSLFFVLNKYDIEGRLISYGEFDLFYTYSALNFSTISLSISLMRLGDKPRCLAS